LRRPETDMGPTLFQIIPKDAAQIILVLFLCFLIGLEREEHKAISDTYGFGGVRTFPLIGLLGYILALLSPNNLALPAVGLAVVGAFLWQSYRHKLETARLAGMTSEVSGLVTYAVGVLVFQEKYWLATTIIVIGVALLELKAGLESLSKRVPGEEILTFIKFLLLTAVILPVVPNRTYGPVGFNPFKAWLVVVAVSAISYGSYLLLKATRGSGGIFLSALLGGAYSSTLTTVVLAKRAKERSEPHLFAGATLAASGFMYFRLVALLALFNHALLQRLAIPFLALAIVGVGGGWAWSRRKERASEVAPIPEEPKNPLELTAALFFGFLFIAMLIITHYSLLYLGRGGFYGLAGVMGLSDVDSFTLSLTQSAGTLTPIELASAGVILVAASNNLFKSIYARAFGDKRTGMESLTLLAIFALLGLLPLLFLKN
jgi:uncharacterized membrane protein (DUF4010 family)